MARIAFIGLGNMGGGMAVNLAKAGHDVRAFDLSEEALERARKAGCLPQPSALAAGEGAEAVVTMLPAGLHVEEVHASGLLDAVDRTAVLIDCSTIEVGTARKLAEAAALRGLMMVDAPVSGGIAAAAAGSLTFMVGGTAEAFARAEPFLAEMGAKVIHAGPSGAGQAAKICNNMLLGATMAATCEAFALAERLGLDPQTFFDISSVSSGQSWSMTSYCPMPGVGPETPADHDYQGGFAAGLMLKDLALAQAAAAEAALTTPMGAQAEQLYRDFVGRGHGRRDFSGLMLDLRGKEPGGAA